MLEVNDLEVQYGDQLAVRGVGLALRAGEVTALVGANGAGKTSVLAAISGVVRPSSGSIVMNGADIVGLRPHKIVRLGVSHVPEGRRIIAPLTVEENLLLGAYVRRRDRQAVQLALGRVYELFPILRERSAGRAGLLSGGEQQMLAFGRALMAGPKAVLLDEPTMGLAPAVIEVVLDAIESMRDQGLAILMVEQNGAAVADVADHIFLLERGEVVGGGRSEDLESSSIAEALLGVTDGDFGVGNAPG